MKFKKRSLCTAGEEVSQLRDKMYALNQKIQNIQDGVDKQLQHFKRGRKLIWGTWKKMSEALINFSLCPLIF